MGRPMKAVNYAGTANTGDPTEVDAKTANGIIQWIQITGLDGANALDVSFDGATFYTIKAGASPLRTSCMSRKFWVRGNGGAVAWCAVTNEG